MIAPLRESKANPHAADRRQLALVRRILAVTLLRSDDEPAPPAIPAWRAWLAAAWLVAVVATYGLTMLGWK